MTEEDTKTKNPETESKQKFENTLTDVADFIEFEIEDMQRPERLAGAGQMNEGWFETNKKMLEIIRQLSEQGIESIETACNNLREEAYGLKNVGNPGPNRDKFYEIMNTVSYLMRVKEINFRKNYPEFKLWHEKNKSMVSKVLLETETKE